MQICKWYLQNFYYYFLLLFYCKNWHSFLMELGNSFGLVSARVAGFILRTNPFGTSDLEQKGSSVVLERWSCRDVCTWQGFLPWAALTFRPPLGWGTWRQGVPMWSYSPLPPNAKNKIKAIAGKKITCLWNELLLGNNNWLPFEFSSHNHSCTEARKYEHVNTHLAHSSRAEKGWKKRIGKRERRWMGN